jgi:hypothetical protein
VKKNNFSAFGRLFFILLAVIFCNVKNASQSEFPIGAICWGEEFRILPAMYNYFDSTGMNTIIQYADGTTKGFLENYNVIAANHDYKTGPDKDWIGYYSTGYYSKWESEENQLDTLRAGVKHKAGKSANWNNTLCWSTEEVTEPACSLIYGPHYRQEKRYKSWTHGCIECVQYTARFNMALDFNPDSVEQNENVCVIKVVFRYGKSVNGQVTTHDTVFRKDTLKISDFNSDGSFKHFTLNPPYQYPSEFVPSDYEGRAETPPDVEVYYTDSQGNNGIQFWVEWLRDDALCTLYIDYAEVYDNNGWDDFVDNPDSVALKVQNYVQSHSNWDNILYWYGHDEPWTIDAFTPMHIIDSLVKDEGGAPLITEFYPYWAYNNLINGDTLIRQFVEMAKLEKLMIDVYPIGPDINRLPTALESLRNKFQEANSLQSDFWYVGQGYGWQLPDESWCVWRRPDSTELKATVMLSLAHGVKGLMFYKFVSEGPFDHDPCYSYYQQGIMDTNFNPTDLFYVIKDNFVPRLKGKLGNTLLKLDYTSNYINKECLNCPQQDNTTNDYLTINHYTTNYFWHAGLLVDSLYSDNKHFLLANLRTTMPVTASLTVENKTDFQNVSFIDIEGGEGRVDTTITQSSSLMYYEQMPAGEGRLYRVAPVLKYGGKLITNDTVKVDINLMDNMTIRNAATVTINDGKEYTALDTIKFEGTGFISGDGYFDRGSNGWVILDSWDYSVFKGREGDHPKIIWSEHPTMQKIHSYRIYRDKGTSGWVPIKILPDSVFEYIDSTVTIITGPPSQNEVSAYYFVAARIEIKEEIVNADSSNTILYRRVEGAGWEKSGTGKTGEVYTYSLNQNYPNPFNPSTTIEYSLERDGNVEIEIMDILGRRVTLLVNEHRQKGYHTVNFNATNLSSGIYFYRIKSGKFVETKKMLLLK